MNGSTPKSSVDAKREFYAQPEIAASYDELRFGGTSGAWVYAREIELVLSLLPSFHRALDLGCGTGRLPRALAQRGTAVGVDTSSAMLAQARRNNPSAFAQGDAFALPFAKASFDAVVALRVVFHFANIKVLLREVARVVAPRGVIVFDTYQWSPRAWLPLDAARWGGGVYIHSPQRILQAARELNLQIAASEHCFLFSPYVYRRLPLAVVRMLAGVEARVPARFRARVFWKVARVD